MPDATLLAGDIGGTNSRLALYTASGGALHLRRSETYPSRSARGLEELVTRFLGQGDERVGAAALAVAGPVVEGRCKATNLPWLLEEKSLAEAARTPRLRLLNDLQALAYGVLFLKPDQLVSLNGVPFTGRGNAAVIAAGTGLGEAYLHWDGSRHHPSPSEGSHGEFGPRNAEELALAGYLIEKFGHPSTERVVSGPGFGLLYDFLVETGRETPPPALRDALAQGDRSATISRLALEGSSPLCSRVMDLFLDAFGAEAGNMALRGFATGGVFVGGGIAPKILPRLRDGRFLAAFEDKGRFRDFCRQIPVSVVLHEDTGLLGASQFARALLD